MEEYQKIDQPCDNKSNKFCLSLNEKLIEPYFRHIIRTNGIKNNYVIFGEQDDVFINFDYTFFKTKDTNLKTNAEEYLKFIQYSNVLIDIRLSLTISYLSFLFDDILIYNSLDITKYMINMRLKHYYLYIILFINFSQDNLLSCGIQILLLKQFTTNHISKMQLILKL